MGGRVEILGLGAYVCLIHSTPPPSPLPLRTSTLPTHHHTCPTTPHPTSPYHTSCPDLAPAAIQGRMSGPKLPASTSWTTAASSLRGHQASGWQGGGAAANTARPREGGRGTHGRQERCVCVVPVHVCVHVCVCVSCVHVYMCTHTHGCVSCVHAYMCVHACMCGCTCRCVCTSGPVSIDVTKALPCPPLSASASPVPAPQALQRGGPPSHPSAAAAAAQVHCLRPPVLPATPVHRGTPSSAGLLSDPEAASRTGQYHTCHGLSGGMGRGGGGEGAVPRTSKVMNIAAQDTVVATLRTHCRPCGCPGPSPPASPT